MTDSDTFDAIADERTQLSSLLLKITAEKDALRQRNNLQSYAIHLKALASATKNSVLIDLCEIWQKNLLAFTDQENLSGWFNINLIQSCHADLQAYLHDHGKYLPLLECLQKSAWLYPLSNEQAQQFKVRLNELNNNLLLEHEEKHKAPQEATATLVEDDINEGFCGSVDDEEGSTLQENANDTQLSDANTLLDDLFFESEDNALIANDVADDDFFDLAEDEKIETIFQDESESLDNDTLLGDGFFDSEDETIPEKAQQSTENSLIADALQMDSFFDVPADESNAQTAKQAQNTSLSSDDPDQTQTDDIMSRFENATITCQSQC